MEESLPTLKLRVQEPLRSQFRLQARGSAAAETEPWFRLRWRFQGAAMQRRRHRLAETTGFA